MPTKAETVAALSRPTVGDGQHPLESTRYILPTPQVEEMCAQVAHWVRLRNPGAIIHAPPRHGKSRGLEILRRDLNESFPGMPVLLLPAWNYTQPKEKSFFSDLLTASGHVLNKSGSADDMRDRLVHFLAEQGTYNGHGRVLLIVDEAQNLHPRHYNWLIGVHNMLSLREVNFIVLLVGQQELLAQRAAFVKADKKQIVGRFMIHAQAFHGVRSSEDLHAILKVYDDCTEYPPGSGWSFTRYYAASEFDRGWRLAMLSEEFWAAFHEARSATPKGRAGDIPMQYVCRTIEHFLLHFDGLQLNDQMSVRSLISAAVANSGYLETLIMS